jgi:hypothetical protein
MIRCRPFLGGLPKEGSPASSLHLRHSDAPTPRRPRLARLRSARRFHASVEASGPPRFLGNPPLHALLSDPGGIARQAIRAVPISRRDDVAFRAFDHTGSHDPRTFRGSITRPARSLSTLRSHGHPCTTQDSLPAGGPPWLGGTRTRWVPSRGFHSGLLRHRFLLAQALPGVPNRVWRSIDLWRIPPGDRLPLMRLGQARPNRRAPPRHAALPGWSICS